MADSPQQQQWDDMESFRMSPFSELPDLPFGWSATRDRVRTPTTVDRTTPRIVDQLDPNLESPQVPRDWNDPILQNLDSGGRPNPPSQPPRSRQRVRSARSARSVRFSPASPASPGVYDTWTVDQLEATLKELTLVLKAKQGNVGNGFNAGPGRQFSFTTDRDQFRRDSKEQCKRNVESKREKWRIASAKYRKNKANKIKALLASENLELNTSERGVNQIRLARRRR